MFVEKLYGLEDEVTASLQSNNNLSSVKTRRTLRCCLKFIKVKVFNVLLIFCCNTLVCHIIFKPYVYILLINTHVLWLQLATDFFERERSTCQLVESYL